MEANAIPANSPQAPEQGAEGQQQQPQEQQGYDLSPIEERLDQLQGGLQKLEPLLDQQQQPQEPVEEEPSLQDELAELAGDDGLLEIEDLTKHLAEREERQNQRFEEMVNQRFGEFEAQRDYEEIDALEDDYPFLQNDDKAKKELADSVFDDAMADAKGNAQVAQALTQSANYWEKTLLANAKSAELAGSGQEGPAGGQEAHVEGGSGAHPGEPELTPEERYIRALQGEGGGDPNSNVFGLSG